MGGRGGVKAGRQACQSATKWVRIVSASRENEGVFISSRCVRKRYMSQLTESHWLMLSVKLAAEIDSVLATVKVANETPGALAG